MQVESAALRAAAVRLRDGVADTIADAVNASRVAQDSSDLSSAFDRYGSLEAFRSVEEAWCSRELGLLITLVNALARALERAADNYDEADHSAVSRMADIR